MGIRSVLPTLDTVSRLWLHALGGLVTAVAAVLVARSSGQQVGPAEAIFAAVLLFALSVAVRLMISEGRAAVRARGRAVRLVQVSLDLVAREAVREERRRLGVDITAYLRAVMEAVATDAESAVSAARGGARDAGLAPAVDRIRALAQSATGELRRQIGLLRNGDDDLRHASEPERVRAGARRPDVAVAILTTVLAGTESVLYPRATGLDVSMVSLLFTVAAASLVVGRRAAPGPSAFALVGCYVAAALLGQRVYSGFWILVTVGGLLWAVGAGAPRADLRWHLLRLPAFLLGPLALVTISAASWTQDAENTPVLAATASVALVGGVVAGQARRRAGAARRTATVREAELDAAREAAVAAERHAFAREIHDVVSHAVGVVAVQAAAAEVLLPARPAAAAACLEVVAATARVALTELDRLPSSAPAGPARRTAADVEALAERIRAAGTPVELHLDGPLGEHADVVYRVVQESLTNVVRHGGGARATVDVRRDGDGVRVCVSDDGGPARPPGPGRGYGLIGLGERVGSVSGSLAAGPDPASGGYRIEARLPGAPCVVPSSSEPSSVMPCTAVSERRAP
jgi:signal transduction histidine kinase